MAEDVLGFETGNICDAFVLLFDFDANVKKGYCLSKN